MRKCPVCSKKYDESSLRFCEDCGIELVSVSDAQSVAASSAKKKGIIIAVVSVILAVIVAVAVFLVIQMLKTKNDAESVNTEYKTDESASYEYNEEYEIVSVLEYLFPSPTEAQEKYTSSTERNASDNEEDKRSEDTTVVSEATVNDGTPFAIETTTSAKESTTTVSKETTTSAKKTTTTVSKETTTSAKKTTTTVKETTTENKSAKEILSAVKTISSGNFTIDIKDDGFYFDDSGMMFSGIQCSNGNITARINIEKGSEIYSAFSYFGMTELYMYEKSGNMYMVSKNYYIYGDIGSDTGMMTCAVPLKYKTTDALLSANGECYVFSLLGYELGFEYSNGIKMIVFNDSKKYQVFDVDVSSDSNKWNCSTAGKRSLNSMLENLY